jgi:hypothetical protein
MRPRRWLLLWLLLFPAIASIAASQPAPTASAFTVSEYISELDRLASATQHLSQPNEIPTLLNSIPPAWKVQSAERTFDVPAEWLRDQLNEWQRKPSAEMQHSIVDHLQTLRSEASTFQDSPPDISQKRVLLNGILAGQEFQSVHGPTWIDRLKQRLVELLLKLLGRVFRSSAIPTVSNIVVYGLIGLAILALAYWMYRTIRNDARVETVPLHSLPVSSKGWKVWLAEARAAADGGNWREAIHLGYWCGISFLEAQGLWRPDTARTPREYLRLLPSSSGQREALGILTRTFELVWYARQEADATKFSETLAQLEKLGCQSN